MTGIDVSALLDDRANVVLVHESDYLPAGGAGAPVAPSTYADKKTSTTERSIIPTAGEGGFHSEAHRDSSGRPVLAPSTVLSSVAGESSRMDEALWRASVDLGLDLPTIVIDPAGDQVIDAVVEEKLAASKKLAAPEDRATAARRVLKTLQMNAITRPHRHVDGAIRSAIDPVTGRQVWAGGPALDDSSTTLYERIIVAGAGNHRELLRLNPTSLIGGFWLSSAAPVLHKQARALSSYITGYDTHEVMAYATKLDSLPVSKKTQVLFGREGMRVTGKASTKEDKDSPSSVGLGPIPGGSAIRVTCASILGVTTLTLSEIRSVLRGEDVDDEFRRAAQEMLVLLAVYQRTLASEQSFIRSECSLVETESRWGVRVRGQKAVTPIEVDVVALEAQVVTALDRARELGVIGESTHVAMSEEQVKVVVDGFFAEKGDKAN